MVQWKFICRIKGQHWWKLSNFFVKERRSPICVVSHPWFLEKKCAQPSQTVYLRAVDSQSILICFDFLSQCICFKVTTGCDRDKQSLMQSNSSSLIPIWEHLQNDFFYKTWQIKCNLMLMEIKRMIIPKFKTLFAFVLIYFLTDRGVRICMCKS